MDRRTYLGIFGTVTVCGGGLGLAYLLDQGAISLGESSDLTETVSNSPESFEFDAAAGSEIRVTITDTGDAPYSGAFTLQNPAGEDVLDGGPRSSDLASQTYTTAQGGTFRLVVNPQGTRVRASVYVTEPTD